MAMTREVFDQSEAAAYLGATRNTVRKALLCGELPARKIGRRWFIGRAALDAWLASGAQSAMSADQALPLPGQRR